MTELKTKLVPSVEKSMQILEYIINSQKACSLREVHTALDIAKTSAYSILNTLIHGGFIQKDQKGLYIPTLKLTAMGLKTRELNNGIRFIRPLLEQLRDKTGFTVFFVIYDNGELIVLDKLDGFGSIIFNSYIGQKKRMNTSAGGKAMAAFLTPHELDVVISKGLDNLTSKSIHKVDEFLVHLDEIRQRGYSIDDGEGELGIRCIGAPVFTYDGVLYGTVSISTLDANLPMTEIPKYAEYLLEATSAMSRELGFKCI